MARRNGKELQRETARLLADFDRSAVGNRRPYLFDFGIGNRNATAGPIEETVHGS